MLAPRRLVMRQIRCDFCNRFEGCGDYFLSANQLIGWQCCQSKECQNWLATAMDEYSLNREALEAKYGRVFKVRRSSGAVEGEWKIREGPFRKELTLNPANMYLIMEPTDNPNSLTKPVDLASLCDWNGVSADDAVKVVASQISTPVALDANDIPDIPSIVANHVFLQT